MTGGGPLQVWAAARLALFVMLAACHKDSPSPDPSASVAESVAAPEVSSSPHVPRFLCPSDVQGAKVSAADIDGGIVVSILGPDGASEAEIRQRAAALASAGPAQDQPPMHRDGPMRPGHHGCAEHVRGTTRDAKDIPGGTALTLTATDPSDVARVRAEVRDRLAGR